MEHRGLHLSLSSVALHPFFDVFFILGYFFWTCFSLQLLLNISAGPGVLLSPPPALELQAHTVSWTASCLFGLGFLIWVLGIELRSLCFQRQHYPRSQLPSPNNSDRLSGIRNWKVELNVVIIQGNTVAWVRAKKKNPLESYTYYRERTVHGRSFLNIAERSARASLVHTSRLTKCSLCSRGRRLISSTMRYRCRMHLGFQDSSVLGRKLMM